MVVEMFSFSSQTHVTSKKTQCSLHVTLLQVKHADRKWPATVVRYFL